MQRIDRSKAKDRSSTISRLVPALLSWYSQNARDLPWRRTRDPYAIWVSEIMLQQTQVKTVLSYWERWMRELPTIESLATASPEKIHKLWEGLGYYTRVRNLQKAARLILERHGGKFPESFDEVLELPGIGRYTAGAICSIAFDQPTPVLDGNVIRVMTRLFGIEKDPHEKKTRARLWHLAEQLVIRASEGDSKTMRFASRASHFNQSLMELGALICTPRRPKCGICPVARNCVARRQGRTDRYPNLGRRVASIPRRVVAFVLRRGNRYLVRQRPAGVVNAHLWEFPNVEWTGPKLNLRAAARRTLGFEPKRLRPLCTVRHSITRYRIQLQVYTTKVDLLVRPAQAKGSWLTLPEMQNLSFPSAHKKVLLQMTGVVAARRQ